MQETIRTRIWQEEPEPDNPFAAAVCRCHGYDVFGDLLGKAGWIEYLFLLFRGEAPTAAQARLLEDLAITLANPGPRDASVHAAMAGGIGGSTAAACLTAALAVGAGGSSGAREVRRFMACLSEWGTDLAVWAAAVPNYRAAEVAEVWPAAERMPGFEPYGMSCSTPVRRSLAHLAELSAGAYLPWLSAWRVRLEEIAGLPLAQSAVAAAALADLGFDPAQGEMLVLLLRLPGAAVHALEQSRLSYREFPFFGLELENDAPPRAAEGAQ